MKNINFSPSARHRSGKCSMRKKIIRYGILISLTLLVVVFWHRHVDIYQCWLPLNKPTQSRSSQKSVQIDSPDKGEQNAAVHPPATEAPCLKEEENRSALKEEENRSAPSYLNPLSPEIFQENASKVPSEGEKIDPMETANRVDKEGKDESTDYYVKVYSSVIKEDAEKTGAYLTQMKYSPQIIREPGFAVMRNVYVTPNSPGIQETVDRLTSDGFSVYLQEDLEHKGNQYIIRVGSCYYLESAKSLLKSLKHKGYSGNIVQEKTTVKFYSVFLGKYSHFEAALEEQRQLNLKGFPTAAVTSVIPACNK